MKTTYLLNNQKQNNMKTKMMKSIVATVIFLTLTIACSKKDNSNSNENISPSKAALLGKWNISSLHFIKKVDGVTETDSTTNNPPNSYIEFRSNDTGYSRFADEYDTAFYKVIGTQVISIDKRGESDTSNIIQMAKNKFTAYEIQTAEDRGKKLIYEETVIYTR